MKKFIAAASSLALVASLGFGFSAPAFAEAAVVINDDGCAMFVPNLDGSVGPFFLSDSNHRVATSSDNGLTVCKADVANPPSELRKARGFLCFTTEGDTTDTIMVVTPSGQATLSCRFNAPKP